MDAAETYAKLAADYPAWVHARRRDERLGDAVAHLLGLTFFFAMGAVAVPYLLALSPVALLAAGIVHVLRRRLRGDHRF